MRLKIGLLSVYFGLFDDAMPGNFRESRENFSNELENFLAQFGEVTFPGLIDSEEKAEDAARVFKEAQLDLIIFAPSMAAPPSYGWIAIKDIPEIFIVALGAQEYSTVPDDYDTEQATKRSLPVGLVMFTNVLARNNRNFISILDTLDSKDLLDNLLPVFKGVSAAKTVTENNFLTIGKPIKGYIDVEASQSELERINVTAVEISKNSLNRKFKIPVILSGGLNPENILDAIDAVNPSAVDVNSGVESSPGKKDYNKLKSLFKNLNKTQSTGFQFG